MKPSVRESVVFCGVVACGILFNLQAQPVRGDLEWGWPFGFYLDGSRGNAWRVAPFGLIADIVAVLVLACGAAWSLNRLRIRLGAVGRFHLLTGVVLMLEAGALLLLNLMPDPILDRGLGRVFGWPYPSVFTQFAWSPAAVEAWVVEPIEFAQNIFIALYALLLTMTLSEGYIAFRKQRAAVKPSG